MSLHKIVILTKVLLKNAFHFNSDKKEGKKNRKGMFAIYLLAYGYLAVIMGVFSYHVIQMLIPIGQQTAFLGLMLVAIGCFVLFQSIFSITNVFYFSKDVEYILPMPVKPAEIVVAKFNIVLITEYITECIIAVVPFIIYGVLTGASPIFYLFALLVLLFFPILPLVLITFVIVLIMSMGNMIKDKDKLQLFATMLLIIVTVGFQMVMMQHTEMTEQQIVEQLMKAEGLVQTIGTYFITILPCVNAMTASHILLAIWEMVKVIMITLIGFTVFIGIGQKLYLKGVIGNLAGGGKKVYSKWDCNKAYLKKEIGISYVKKEFKILIRNPIFFMQCVLPPILMPVLILFVGGAGSSASSQEWNALSQDINTIASGIFPVVILLAVIQFFMMFNFIAITAVSRDGKNAAFMKYIPIPLQKQMMYKIIPGVLMNLIPMLLTVGFAKKMIPQIPIITIIGVMLVCILTMFIQGFLMIIVDLKRPKLQWDTEYAVVKQNMNMVFEIILGFLLITVFILAGVLLSSLPLLVNFAILMILLGTILIAIYQYIGKNQEKLFEKII